MADNDDRSIEERWRQGARYALVMFVCLSIFALLLPMLGYLDRAIEQPSTCATDAAAVGTWRATNLIAFLGVFQTAATIVGIVFVYRTLKDTRKTLEMATRTADGARRAERAYLFPTFRAEFCGEGDPGTAEHREKIRVSVQLNNAGKTAALRASFAYHVYNRSGLVSNYHKGDELVVRNLVVPANAEIDVATAYFALDEVLSDSGERGHEDKGQCAAYVHTSWIYSRDVFGENRQGDDGHGEVWLEFGDDGEGNRGNGRVRIDGRRADVRGVTMKTSYVPWE